MVILQSQKILIFNQLQNKKSFHGHPIFKVVLGAGVDVDRRFFQHQSRQISQRIKTIRFM